MEQPEGFVSTEHPDHVCKLRKSIYGLKQASRQWHEKIDGFLIGEMSFTASNHDPCLYVRKDKRGISIITLYVDDLLIASSNLNDLSSIKSKLASRFKMKDCGRASICLGLEIRNDPNGKKIFLSQKRYAEKILGRFGMLNSKPISTPMDQQVSLDNLKGELVDPTLYRQAIGSLMYLSVGTRPDITFAVSRLAQYVENPTKQLWTLVKRIFRYISGTRNMGIAFNETEPLAPLGYTDSDWGGCKTSRKSTSSFSFIISGGLVSWKSKKQTCVAQSSSKAEYIALSIAVKEAIWIQEIFKFLMPDHYQSPILLFVDNQGSIKMAKNDASGTRTKHIDVRYHFARDMLSKNLYTIEYIPTSLMVADILTKPLQRLLFK
eukprot:IDg1876t1